jgi:hypothetical protein
MTARQSTSVRGRPQTHQTCLRAGATGEQLANESEPKTHKFKGFGEPQANAGAVTVSSFVGCSTPHAACACGERIRAPLLPPVSRRPPSFERASLVCRSDLRRSASDQRKGAKQYAGVSIGKHIDEIAWGVEARRMDSCHRRVASRVRERSRVTPDDVASAA